VRGTENLAERAVRRGARSGSVALRAILELFGDDLARGVFTPAAAGTDRELALHFKQRASTVIHGVADLTITHCIADAYVHLKPLI
jgi:hypothetical protein